MAVDLAVEARERGIKYFLISYVDLFCTLRAKLAPAAAIGDMAKDGAGFAGFASWLDMTPADPDLFARPDPSSLIQLPWKPEVAWLAADLWMNGAPVEQAPRNILKRLLTDAARDGLTLDAGRLAQELGCPVVETVAVRRRGLDLLREAVADALDAPAPTLRDVEDLRANGLAGTDIPVSVLPGGSTNVVARSLGIPNDVVDGVTRAGARGELYGDSPSAVRRALSVIEDRAHEELTLEQLAGAVAVTPRALQYAFRKELGCTPQDYLRRVRLDLARQSLRDGSAQSVGDAAARFGFFNPGRFASDYRQVFDENPGQTLLRPPS